MSDQMPPVSPGRRRNRLFRHRHHSRRMQRAVISGIVFVGLILIFDMLVNDSRLTLQAYDAMRVAGRHFDNYATNLVNFFNRG
jgi:hypothetical protein